ncbi:hypothetical protein lbkm_2367 [Lachnospiraceae bacterium KM106-2]|nr:hypothetical protein lbkm_2367 [Lachnospiraceae bacterium KM106-2]
MNTLGQTCEAEITGNRPGTTYLVFTTADGKFTKKVKVNVTAQLIDTNATHVYGYQIDTSIYKYTNAKSNTPKIMYLTKFTNQTKGAERVKLNWISLNLTSLDAQGNTISFDSFTPVNFVVLDTKDVPNDGDSTYYCETTSGTNYNADNARKLGFELAGLNFGQQIGAFNIPVEINNNGSNMNVDLSNYSLEGVFDKIYLYATVKITDTLFNTKPKQKTCKLTVKAYGANGELLTNESRTYYLGDGYYEPTKDFIATKLVPDSNAVISKITIDVTRCD